MDDTQDKVRRNLVVFGAAIVIGWFLDLKLTAVTKLFVSAADLDHVNVGKLWVVILLALLYLFLRYRFDVATNKQLATLFEEFRTIKNNYLFKYLFRKISQINRTAKSLPIFDSSLMERVNQEVEKYEKEHSQKIGFRLHISNPWGNSSPIDSSEFGSFWKGEVSISEEYLKAGSAGNLVVISGRKHYFSIPISGRIWIIWHAIIHVFSYSKSAVDFIVPIILSVAALSVIANRLLTIYLPDF